MKNVLEKPAITEIIDALMKAGYAEDEAEALVARLLEEEAEGYLAVVKELKNKVIH